MTSQETTNPSAPIRGPRGGLRPRPKPILRNVRLDIPDNEEFRNRNQSLALQRGNSLPPCPPTAGGLNFMSAQFSPLEFPIRVQETQIFSPSIFLEFDTTHETNPVFVFNALLPTSAQPFTAQYPNQQMTNPCLLCYFVAKDRFSQFPVRVLVNNTPIQHICSDGQPVIITDLLAPFGQDNWIIVDRAFFSNPFTVIGVWAQQRTMDQLLIEIAGRRPFSALQQSSLDLCPISRAIIEIPARGVNCEHQECFDAAAFVTAAQALGGNWECPICHRHLSLDEMLVDASTLLGGNGGGMDQVGTGGNSFPDFGDGFKDSFENEFLDF